MAPSEMGSPIPRSAVRRGPTLKSVDMAFSFEVRASGGLGPGRRGRVVLDDAPPGVFRGSVVPLALWPQGLDGVRPLDFEPILAAQLFCVGANDFLGRRPLAVDG